MFQQIEITTLCNFRCFYCIGREMPQRHMDEATMESVLARLTPGKHLVSLQGEGEPTLHPRFWDWTSRLHSAGYVPYTITNGHRIDADRFDRYFPVLGISLDTTHHAEATRIGRLHLDRVLANLDLLLTRMGPKRLIIHTVNYGQPLAKLVAYLKDRGIIRHLIQPLQTKADYARRYPAHPAAREVAKPIKGPCHYLGKSTMRYFDVDGREYPCCYIKDATVYPGSDILLQGFTKGIVPPSCQGCREIPIHPTPQRNLVQTEGARV